MSCDRELGFPVFSKTKTFKCEDESSSFSCTIYEIVSINHYICHLSVYLSEAVNVVI